MFKRPSLLLFLKKPKLGRRSNMTIHFPKSLHLGPYDAAIILREDGTLEASIPPLDQSDVPDNIITGAAVMLALQNERMCGLIYENFLNECAFEDVVPINDF